MTISTRSTPLHETAYRLCRCPYTGAAACKANGAYARGTTWTVPEHDLDKALATYRKQDQTFRQRIKKAAMYFSPKDAETVILLATHNIVRLELVIQPIQVREKPYYL